MLLSAGDSPLGGGGGNYGTSRRLHGRVVGMRTPRGGQAGVKELRVKPPTIPGGGWEKITNEGWPG